MPNDTHSQGRAEAAVLQYCGGHSGPSIMHRAFLAGVQWSRDNADPAHDSAGVREVVEAAREWGRLQKLHLEAYQNACNPNWKLPMPDDEFSLYSEKVHRNLRVAIANLDRETKTKE